MGENSFTAAAVTSRCTGRGPTPHARMHPHARKFTVTAGALRNPSLQCTAISANEPVSS